MALAPVITTGRLVGHGRCVVTTAATPVSLSTGTYTCDVALSAVTTVMLQSDADNTGRITYGRQGVVGANGTRQGVSLDPGEAHPVGCRGLASVFIDATVSGEEVTVALYA